MSTLLRPQNTWTSAQPLRQLFDHLSDPVLVFDRYGALNFANSAALRLLGCEPGQFIGGLAPCLGEPATTWLRRALLGPKPGGTLPAARLPDGRNASLVWQALGPSHWVLHLGGVPAGLHSAHADRRTTGAPAQAPVVTGEVVNNLLKVVWDSPFPVALLNSAFCIVDVNTPWGEFIGQSRDALIGQDPLQWRSPEDQAALRRVRDALSQEGSGRLLSTWLSGRLLAADGRERWYRAAYRVLEDAAGQRYFLEILQDETAEHVARERADRSARELDDWFELSPVGMVLFDETGLLIRTNRAFDASVGTLPVALPQAPLGLQKLLAWNESALQGLQPGQAPLVREGWIPHADGSMRRLRGSVRCYRAAGGQRRFMAVAEDRSLEEERELAQVQIGALMNTAGVGLATFQDHSGAWGLKGQRPTLASLSSSIRPGAPLGGTAKPASPAGDLQSIQREMVLPESLPEFDKMQQALREARRAEVRYAIQHPELGMRWLSTRVEPAVLASGKRTTSVVTLDITEQQELLNELSTILESTTAGIAYIRGDKLVRCNLRFQVMLGLNGKPVAGRTAQELFGLHPLAAKIAADTLKALSEGPTYETEFQVPHAARADPVAPQWYALSVRRTGTSKSHGEAIALLSDITRLKLQQRELEVLVRDRELMFNLSEVGIAFVRHNSIERANDALSSMSGYSVDELKRLPLRQLFIGNAPDAETTLRNRGRWMGEHPLRRRDGRLMWVQVSNRLVLANDPSAGFIASYVNVDARHRAEQAVVLQAERTRAILDSVLVGIVTVGPGGIEWMNRSARRMFGADLVDFMNLPISTVATPESDHPFRRTQYLDELIEGEAETFECRVKARDGREFWVVGNAVVTSSESSGRQLTYALLDIERRRQAEARIAEAQASMQLIIEAAPLAIILWDAATLRVLQINTVAARLLNRTVVDCIGLSLDEVCPPGMAAMLRPDLHTALQGACPAQREYQIPLEGEPRTWDARYLPLATLDQAPDKLLLVASDITEQQVAQQAKLDAAIQQREMLVREVHHRIKNNLQGVAGLLQQIAQRKPEVASVIFEVVGQVQAIAQVYGLQVGVTGPLRLVSVLEAIAGSVKRTFGRSLHFEAVGGAPGIWILPEAEAIPIALTVNELLTNAIKHSAHVPNTSVSCRFMADRADGVCIVIANTAQLPEGFQLARVPGGVSGLGLVRALMPRRSAQLTLEQAGTQVVATVSLSPPCISRWLEPTEPGG